MPSLPLWAIFIFTTAVLFGGLEIGHVLGRRRRERDEQAEKDELGSLVGAILGLLAFVLAIAFGGQLSRFDASKSLLLDEATAIYAVFLRADMLPPDAGNFVKRQLQKYAEVRLDTDRNLAERVRESIDLQRAIWQASIQAGEEMSDAFPKELYFESLNELITLHEKRVTLGLHEHMPGVIWWALYLLAVLGFAVTGYHGAVSSAKRSAARPVAVLAFALLITLIADLDNPGRGPLQLNEAALRDVSARMQADLAEAG